MRHHASLGKLITKTQHTAMMPHKSDTCEMGFGSKSDFKRHLTSKSRKTKVTSIPNPDAPPPHSCQPCNVVDRDRHSKKT